MIVVFLGPPGSGKGTQAARLSARLGISAISTGDLLRQAVARGTALGEKARVVMERGELVPDELVEGVLRERLTEADCRDGFLLDGYPRNVAQAEALDAILGSTGRGLDRVINILVSEKVAVARLAGRARSERRADDDPETVRERQRVYREKTSRLVEYYRSRGLIVDIPGEGTVDEVSSAIENALKLPGAA